MPIGAETRWRIGSHAEVLWRRGTVKFGQITVNYPDRCRNRQWSKITSARWSWKVPNDKGAPLSMQHIHSKRQNQSCLLPGTGERILFNWCLPSPPSPCPWQAQVLQVRTEVGIRLCDGHGSFRNIFNLPFRRSPSDVGGGTQVPFGNHTNTHSEDSKHYWCFERFFFSGKRRNCCKYRPDSHISVKLAPFGFGSI